MTDDAGASESTAVVAKEEYKQREYTPEEIAEIAKRVETPKDNTPPYQPTHKLSPEFEGTSNYEMGMRDMKREAQERLEKLKLSPDTSQQKLNEVEEDLKALDCLYENFNLGMNVFRTAKGGRDKLRA